MHSTVPTTSYDIIINIFREKEREREKETERKRVEISCDNSEERRDFEESWNRNEVFASIFEGEDEKVGRCLRGEQLIG